MAKKPAVRVARAAVIAAFSEIRGLAPPTLSVDRALREIGPDLRRMLKEEDWSDDDLITALLKIDERRLKQASEATDPALDPPLRLTRESVEALIGEMMHNERKQRRVHERRAKEKRRSQEIAAGAIRSSRAPTQPERRALQGTAGAQVLLSDQTHAGAEGNAPLALPAPDTMQNRNPGID